MYHNVRRVVEYLVPNLSDYERPGEEAETIVLELYTAKTPDTNGARVFRDADKPGEPSGSEATSLFMALELDLGTLSAEIAWNSRVMEDLGQVHVEGMLPDVPKYQPPVFPRHNPEWQEPSPENFGYITQTADILDGMVRWLDGQLAAQEAMEALGEQMFNNAYALLSYLRPELAEPGALEGLDAEQRIAAEFIADEPDPEGVVAFSHQADTGITEPTGRQTRVRLTLDPQTQSMAIERIRMGATSEGTVLVQGWLPAAPRFLPAAAGFGQDWSGVSPENLQAIQDTDALLSGMVRYLGK